MKILVVGSGGREHAIIRKLKQSPKAEKIFCCPGNGGISADAECVAINAMDIEGVVNFSKENQIDLVVVAPDDPLAAGMVDALNAEGIMTFGPTKAAAQIEASKVFAKDLMKQHNIPTASYEVFDDPAKALSYIEQKNEYPVVIKADGLALGKGVIIAADHDEAKEGLKEIMEDKVFGASGNQVVVEEFLTGPEVSVLAFVDEILRGTNTIERIAASAAVLQDLSGKNILVMAATHDIELTRILAGYQNIHFREQVGKDGVTFDYKLRPGPSRTRNALELLGQMGFAEETVSRARTTAARFEREQRWGVLQDE